MAIEKADWRPIWWSTIIVTLTSVIIGSILRLIEKNYFDKSAYDIARGFFASSQPDYFPLLFLFVTFFMTFAIVIAYRAMLPKLPSNWVFRGLLVGAFLFLIGDLPKALLMGYSIVVPPAATQMENVYPVIARGTAVAELFNKIINGCVLTYCYWRFSPEWVKKQEKL